jgi:hypothetical protein
MSAPVTRMSMAPLGPLDAMWLWMYFLTKKQVAAKYGRKDEPPGRYHDEIQAGISVARRALDEDRSRPWWRRFAAPRPPLPGESSRAAWQHHMEAFLNGLLLKETAAIEGEVSAL